MAFEGQAIGTSSRGALRGLSAIFARNPQTANRNWIFHVRLIRFPSSPIDQVADACLCTA
jgi:hypothetical protein